MQQQRRYRRKKVLTETPTLNGRYPISFYLIAAITLGFIAWGVLNHLDILILLLYALIIFGSLYLPFSRNTSRFKVENGLLRVYYLFGGSMEIDLHNHELTYCELGSWHSDHGRFRFIGTHDILQFEHRITHNVVTVPMNAYHMDMRRLLAIIPYQKKPLPKQRLGLTPGWPTTEEIDL